MEALLKRVDGLEKRLHDENKPEGSPGLCDDPVTLDTTSPTDVQEPTERPKSEPTEMSATSPAHDSPALLTPTESLYEYSAEPRFFDANKRREQSLPNLTDIYIDTYFARVHGKPYHILDEGSIRQRCQTNQLPTFLLHSIYAVSAR